MAPPLGAVLCGGASRRMGVDKATLVVEGVAMARRVADALAMAGCSPVIAVGGEATELGELGLEHAVDEFPGEGPLGGILTALSHGAPAVVLACDLPNITAPTIATLVNSVLDHDAAIAYSDHAEPLCAVWSPSAARLLRARFDAGERALHRAIDGLDIAWVVVPAAELRNVNTPADLRSL
jgi:molybdopterin-guanine dinucleotide biosynthesis protein A